MDQLQIFENGEQPKKKIVDLDLKQVKAITHGALYIYGDMGGFTFSRFTPAQIDHYSKTPLFKSRSQMNSGVYFDFYTDSPCVNIEFICLDTVTYKPTGSLDILENGALCHSIAADFKIGKKYSVKYALSGRGRTRLTIYLPNATTLIVKRIALTEGCEITPVKNSKKLLLLGDSITQGMMVDHSCFTYANVLQRIFDTETLNQGVAGYYYDVNTLDGGLSFGPDCILVAYGSNDKKYVKTINELMANVEAFVKKLTTMYKKAKVFLVIPWWRMNLTDDRYPLSDFTEIRTAIEDVVEKYPHITVIDGFSATPHMSEFFADGRTHPNEAAHMMMAQHIAGVLRKFIK